MEILSFHSAAKFLIYKFEINQQHTSLIITSMPSTNCIWSWRRLNCSSLTSGNILASSLRVVAFHMTIFYPSPIAMDLKLILWSRIIDYFSKPESRSPRSCHFSLQPCNFDLQCTAKTDHPCLFAIINSDRIEWIHRRLMLMPKTKTHGVLGKLTLL